MAVAITHLSVAMYLKYFATTSRACLSVSPALTLSFAEQIWAINAQFTALFSQDKNKEHHLQTIYEHRNGDDFTKNRRSSVPFRNNVYALACRL